MENKKDNNVSEIIEKAYLYLVKIPGSNDTCICASDAILYPGTYVVCPTRYGLDMGLVLGNAPSENPAESYCPGCAKVRGGCNFGPTDEQPDDSLEAYGEPEKMGDVPVFEFKYTSELEDTAKAPVEENHDGRFKQPVAVEVDGDVLWIDHMATPNEISRYQSNLELEKQAIKVCKEKIEKHKLDMKLVTAHFLLSEPKALFFFTAEERVDFRELVKDLVSVFKMRIELRQIGVRDESRVLGGLAVCGRDFCCHCVSDQLDPVTIKMAKEQNLSLNSLKISGPCGRLLCCLSYEYDFYLEEKQSYPPEGSRLKIGDELFRVSEVNILSKTVSCSGSEGRNVTIPRESLFYSAKNSRWEVSRKFQEDFLGN